MNNVGEKYLPLGSVVMLKGASKRLMVTGFCTMAADDESGVMFDYSGCMYPEGVISSDQTALFNHDQIEKVYHLGLVDEEEKSFKVKLNQLINSENVVSESAPAVVREQEGINVPTAEPAVEAIPAIGPGLPGYVAPVVEAPAMPAAPVVPEQPAVEAIPPIGPGLPGYVAPQAVEVAPAVAATIPANEMQQSTAVETSAPTKPAFANIQFDENGFVVSE